MSFSNFRVQAVPPQQLMHAPHGHLQQGGVGGPSGPGSQGVNGGAQMSTGPILHVLPQSLPQSSIHPPMQTLGGPSSSQQQQQSQQGQGTSHQTPESQSSQGHSMVSSAPGSGMDMGHQSPVDGSLRMGLGNGGVHNLGGAGGHGHGHQNQNKENHGGHGKAPYGSGDSEDGYTLVFNSMEEFQAWRNKEEEEKVVEFVKGDTHGSKAVPPRFKDHTKLVCARHQRSGRKKYVKKHPERVRKVPSRKLEGEGCPASISYKTYFETDQVRACYMEHHSHEIGDANLPFTRRGRRMALDRGKKETRRNSENLNSTADNNSYDLENHNDDSSLQNVQDDDPNVGSSSMVQQQPQQQQQQPQPVQPQPPPPPPQHMGVGVGVHRTHMSMPVPVAHNHSVPNSISMIAPLPQTLTPLPVPVQSVSQPPPHPTPHSHQHSSHTSHSHHPQQQPQQPSQQSTQQQQQDPSQDRWERMTVLFQSARSHTRNGFEFPSASVAALESVLIRLYLESPMIGGSVGVGGVGNGVQMDMDGHGGINGA
ncbi:hypothetical protein SISNIDRAFT_483277 [Sistotremastrum niveocremeum HHB9708]|uniref:Uncharacterized protein n=1 Tax=Sistotremastrum niveocremeum HHB9708 TaxID=1314777 RepID=A0A164XD07_9AGAM|nr:hypothetical protein SISNIDRAFT_483277 [Sistotremastrum niveocremeum HHB9708]